jgi:hypothetical protein
LITTPFSVQVEPVNVPPPQFTVGAVRFNVVLQPVHGGAVNVVLKVGAVFTVTVTVELLVAEQPLLLTTLTV